MTSPTPRQVPKEEVRRHYEFLRGWLLELGYDVKRLVMPPTTVLVEEYGRVRSVEETAREAVGWCFGPYGKWGGYTIFMREDYADPHLGAEIL
jgi:hypothetical protein